jgi:hypothetical protein
VVVASAATFSGSQTRPIERKLRVGTYDNRAIAVAFVRWRLNPMADKRAEYEKAKRAGETVRAQELEAWGEKQQRKSHRQGFGRVPVDDLLAHVKPGVAEVASQRELDAIAWFCDYTSAEVELVDVTDDLVRLFEPSEETLKTVRELREREPLDLDEIEAGHDH